MCCRVVVEVGAAHHQMNMRRSHRMSIQRTQQLITRSIRRQRISRWSQTIKPILSILIRLKLSSQIIRRLVIRILEIVFSIAARLPEVECDVWNGLLSGEITDYAMHVCYCAFVLVLDYGVPEFAPGCVGRPEGTEDCGGGGGVVWVFGLDVVCYFCYEAVLCVSIRSIPVFTAFVELLWYLRF